MANRQTFVVGALGVLVGLAVGASATQNAQVVSFGGQNPNSVLDTINPREANDGVYNNNRSNNYGIDIPYTRGLSLQESVAARRAQRLHAAAESGQFALPGCEGLTRTRMARCNVAVMEQGAYQRNYYEAE